MDLFGWRGASNSAANEDNLVTRLDLTTPSEDDRAFLEFINKNLIGQPAAKEMLLRIHRAAKNPFRDRTRPIYKALMPGDSHTGKTETACVLADYYHGNPEAFIRINCANYKNEGDLTRLLGASAQWVGYKKPPTEDELANNKDIFDPSALLSAQNLTASRKGSKTPYTIVLLDEFEKAGDEFEQFILAIYSAAKERMGNNMEVDFSDCIFLMPCNLGMSEIAKKSKSSYGFLPPQIDTTSELAAIINRRYPIEVVNRFDEVCVYGKLSSDDIKAVLGLHIAKVQKRVNQALGESSFTIVVEESARKRLLELCLNDRGDVADLKRVVPRHLTDPISVAVETGAIGSGDELIVSCEEGKAICFDRKGQGPVKKLDSTKLSTNTTEAPAKEQESAAPPRSVNAEARALTDKANQLPIEKKKQAIDWLKKALAKLESQPDAILSVHINNRIGILLDDNTQAAQYFADAINARTALTSNEEKSSIPVSILYANLAISLSSSGRQEKAKEFLRRGMQQIRQHRKSETLYGLLHFITTSKQHAPEQAEDLFELASSLMKLSD